MSVAVIVARVILAGVFVVAAWAKLTDRAGTRQAVRDFGVPEDAAPAVAVLVPLAEVTVAVLLVIGPVVVAAVGALAVLVVFAAAVAVSLARGRRPDCHCFGRVSSEPVSARTLGRNLILIGAALFVLARA